MSEIKTKVSDASVEDTIAAVPDQARRQDSRALLELFGKVTGLAPRLWGNGMVGFGSYHYKSERSRQEGDWPLTGFAPRKQNLAIYVMPGFAAYAGLLKKLGKFNTGAGCLYVNKLADVDPAVLEELIRRSVADMKKLHGVKP